MDLVADVENAMGLEAVPAVLSMLQQILQRPFDEPAAIRGERLERSRTSSARTLDSSLGRRQFQS